MPIMLQQLVLFAAMFESAIMIIIAVYAIAQTWQEIKSVGYQSTLSNIALLTFLVLWGIAFQIWKIAQVFVPAYMLTLL